MSRLLLAALTALCLLAALFLAVATAQASEAPAVGSNTGGQVIATAQITGTRITQMQAPFDFGDSITFTARLESSQPVETVVLFFQAQNDPHTTLGEASLAPQPDGTSRLSYTHRIEDYHLRAFSRVDYRWEVTLKGGQVYKSPPDWFYYADNRFAWNSLEEDSFKVYWYDGDQKFGQDVLDAAQQGMQQVQGLLPLPVPKGLDLYVYPDSESMQAALRSNSADWVAGHADPDLGVVVVALPAGPDQSMLIRQRVPHELMHILLYQATDLGYANLPTWLNEGLASQAELSPNSDYRLLLEDAVQREALIPLAALCQTFPRDASGAILSYAESASFVKYLHDTYGVSGLQRLVTTYANGLDCERGAQMALGRNLTRLERDWRRDVLAEDTLAAAANNLLPWLVLLMAAMLAPIILVVRHWRRSRVSKAVS